MENLTFSLRLCIDSFHRYWIKWLLHMNMDLPQTDTQVIVLLHMQLLSHLVKTKGVTDYYFSWWPSVLVSSVFLLYHDKTTNVKLKAEEQISPWIWRWWESAAVWNRNSSCPWRLKQSETVREKQSNIRTWMWQWGCFTEWLWSNQINQWWSLKSHSDCIEMWRV